MNIDLLRVGLRLPAARSAMTWKALGHGGVVALALLAMAATAAFALTPAWRAEAERLQSEAQARARRPQPAPEQPWHESLPPAAQSRERLANLLELALRRGVIVQRSDQRVQRDPESVIERVQLTMPVLARYEDLRGFLEAALAADPALSLDSLRLHRGDVQKADVEAALVWSLHQRAETGKESGR